MVDLSFAPQPSRLPPPPLDKINYQPVILTSTSGSSHRELLSTRWSPLILNTCHLGRTPAHFAPCVAARHSHPGTIGEELIYTDFQLRAPLFHGRQGARDRAHWLATVAGITERGTLVGGTKADWLVYRGQHGQNLVFTNATVNIDISFDSWSERACMCDKAALNLAVPETTTAGVNEPLSATQAKVTPSPLNDVDTLVVAHSPDAYSWQHFLDRSTHIVQQGAHLIPPRQAEGRGRAVVTGRQGNLKVQEMWALLGFSESKNEHIHSRSVVSADRVVFSCRTPLVHPYLSLGAVETLGLAAVPVPLENRKTIAYFSRTTGRTTNSSRKVLNEPALLAAIDKLLVSRGQGEELLIFEETAFESFAAMAAFLHTNVRAVIGPHGGSLYHHRFTGPNTLVLEFQPETIHEASFYEEASLLSQVYRLMSFPPAADGMTDFDVDVEAVIEVLTKQLGRRDERGESVAEAYQWTSPELGLAA